MVADTVPKARIGSAMGLLGTMSAVGTAVGPSLGGFLIAAAGWRSMFFVSLPLALLALLLAYRHLPVDRPSGERMRFDTLGTLLLGSSLAAYAFAMVTGRLALLAAAGVGLALFTAVERRAPAPLIQLDMLAKPGLRAALLVSALVMTVMMTTLVVGPFYLTRGLGLNPGLAGLAMSAGPVVAALTGWPAGRLVDGFGARSIAAAGLSGMAAGCVLLSLSPPALGLWGYVGPVVVLTSGYALFQTANNSAVMGDVAAEQRAVVSGLLNLSRNLGLITGASAMGAVFAIGAGTADVMGAEPGAVASGMRIAFTAGVLLVGFALALSGSSRRRAADGGSPLGSGAAACARSS